MGIENIKTLNDKLVYLKEYTGLNFNDVGSFCKATTSLNKWSKHKPINSTKISLPTDAKYIEEATTNTFGLTIPIMTASAVKNASSFNWIYNTVVAPFRLDDFNYYINIEDAHEYGLSTKWQSGYSGIFNTYIDSHTTTYNDSYINVSCSMSYQDGEKNDTLLYPTDLNLTNYHLGLVLLKNNSNTSVCYITSSTTTEDADVSVPLDLPSLIGGWYLLPVLVRECSSYNTITELSSCTDIIPLHDGYKSELLYTIIQSADNAFVIKWEYRESGYLGEAENRWHFDFQNNTTKQVIIQDIFLLYLPENIVDNDDTLRDIQDVCEENWGDGFYSKDNIAVAYPDYFVDLRPSAGNSITIPSKNSISKEVTQSNLPRTYRYDFSERSGLVLLTKEYSNNVTSYNIRIAPWL